jgi:hypothetical protein
MKTTSYPRNFEFAWSSPATDDVSSNDPCSEVYSGPRPNSEPEAWALDILLRQNAEHIAAFISLHSYASMILTPYAYTKQAVPKDLERLTLAAGAMRDEMARVAKSENNRTRVYQVGTVASQLYRASGLTIDLAYGALNITHSYTVELPGEADGVTYGFLLPPRYIREVGRETSAGVAALAEFIKKEGATSLTTN